MTNDSGSMSGKCGCGSDSNTKKGKEPCPSSGSEKKSGFSKTPCKTPGGKGKCHESHEQFKKKHTDSCSDAGGESSRGKCSNSYREFSRTVGSDNPCGGGRTQDECHDSHKKFLESKHDDCANSHEVLSKQESRVCKEPQVRSVPCAAETKQDPCSSSTGGSFSTSQETKQDCKSQVKKGPCSSTVPEKKEPPCASNRGKPEEASLYSKITSRCKCMAQDFVRPKSKSKCSGVDESSLKKESICSKTAPPSTLPCPPKTEKGVGYAPPCCTSRATCPDSKPTSWADFFPLDARNQKLNSCIDKYSKIDPGQVISQCSQFANKPMDSTERCKQQVNKLQQRCTAGRGQGVQGAGSPRKSIMLISPHNRLLMSRWAPSAAKYLVTSALITLYLTEWKAVPWVYQDFTDKPDKEAS